MRANRSRKPLADAVLEKVGALWNMYGPTETTVWSGVRGGSGRADPAVVSWPADQSTPRYGVLDPQTQPVAFGGDPGELYIGGEGVTQRVSETDRI
ncbi:AMP-binding protein [Vibrio sp. PP-XX7]